MWGLVKALILYGFAATARDSRRMLPDLAIRFAIVFAVITCLFLLPPLLNSGSASRRLPEMAHLVSLYLTPSASVLTLPVALFIAVVLHMFGIAKPVRAQLIRGMLPIALSCGIASLVLTQRLDDYTCRKHVLSTKACDDLAAFGGCWSASGAQRSRPAGVRRMLPHQR